MPSRKNELEDRLLVLRSQEGDAAAFGELVRRWQERLWRHAWRLTGDRDAAWDALQETWIAVGSGIAHLEDAAAFPAWVYRITSNKCRDWIRREGRRNKALTTLGQVEEVRQESQIADTERAESLKEAISKLSQGDRAILALYYEEDFGIAEIAQILEIPPGTVKSRLYHTRQRLRKILEVMNHE